MKRFLLFLIAAVVVAAPFTTLAHEHRTYRIGDKTYAFTVGSVGEPVFVDDKSGVEVRVEEMAPAMAQDDHAAGDGHAAGTPVTGLEATLDVEVIAGDRAQLFELRPAFGEPGTYRASFFPTVQTTYTYRLLGTVNGAPFDAIFTCNPAGHPATPEVTDPVKLSDQVTQTAKSGTFGCPQARTDVSFPEPTASLAQLSAEGIDTALIGVILGGLGTLLAIAAFIRAGRD